MSITSVTIHRLVQTFKGHKAKAKAKDHRQGQGQGQGLTPLIEECTTEVNRVIFVPLWSKSNGRIDESIRVRVWNQVVSSKFKCSLQIGDRFDGSVRPDWHQKITFALQVRLQNDFETLQEFSGTHQRLAARFHFKHSNIQSIIITLLLLIVKH